MNQKIRRFLCCCLAVCQLFTMTAHGQPDWPADTGIQAEAGIVIDADSGAVLFGQKIHVSSPPASITKLLTALVVLEHCQLDETITISEEALANVEPDSGDKMYLVAGDTMTVEDALHALILVSANQVANALAEHAAGSMSDFVELMNQKVAELGCTNTHFDNPSGLNGDTQYVSAYDMSLIARAAFANEDLLRISSTVNYRTAPTANNPDGRSLRHEHRFLYVTDPNSVNYYPYAVAGKTGYLLKAGNTLVTYAEKEGRHLICVILKGSYESYFQDTKTLLEFGFNSFQNINIADQEQSYVTGSTPLTFGEYTFQPSQLMIETGRVVTLPKNASLADATLTLEELPNDHPPDAVALLSYSYNDRNVGSAFLLVKDPPEGFGQPPEPEIETSAGDEMPDPTESTASPEGSDDGGFLANLKLPELKLPSLPSLPSGAALIVASVVLLVGINGVLVAFISHRRKKEAEALARRRERRRQRLMQDGDQEEFDRLMAERAERLQKRKR